MIRAKLPKRSRRWGWNWNYTEGSRAEMGICEEATDPGKSQRTGFIESCLSGIRVCQETGEGWGGGADDLHCGIQGDFNKDDRSLFVGGTVSGIIKTGELSRNEPVSSPHVCRLPKILGCGSKLVHLFCVLTTRACMKSINVLTANMQQNRWSPYVLYIRLLYRSCELYVWWK